MIMVLKIFKHDTVGGVMSKLLFPFANTVLRKYFCRLIFGGRDGSLANYIARIRW